MANSPRFALLALPESTPTALYGLYEVLLSVGRTWEEMTGERADAPSLTPKIVTRDGKPVIGAYGIPIAPHEPMGEADVLIVTDLVLPTPFEPGARWRAELDWVRERHAAGAIVCSVCTGSVFLAEAGILDGQEATTHWSAVDIFRERYPQVKLSPQKILAPAGPGHQIITGGGATAWEELALYLVARFSGGAEAVRISKIFLLGDHSDGQLPFAGARRAKSHDDAVIADVQVWIADNYHRSNPVAAMIDRSGLAERTFIRRFRTATGYTPMEYVQTLRLEEAKHLLETSDIPMEQVAVEVGYEDSNFFRRLFKRVVGITPARYRQRFSVIARSELAKKAAS
ncbi:MAG: GlxA family transcriptional regulator [Paracoccaceae bacterium]